MPWTAEKVNVTKDRDQVAVTVRYSDGAKSFEETYKASGTVSPGWLEDIAANKIVNLEAAAGLSVNTGKITPTPITPPDYGFLAFRRDISVLGVVSQLVALGIDPKNYPQIAALKGRIEAALTKYWDRLIDVR